MTAELWHPCSRAKLEKVDGQLLSLGSLSLNALTGWENTGGTIAGPVRPFFIGDPHTDPNHRGTDKHAHVKI